MQRQCSEIPPLLTYNICKVHLLKSNVVMIHFSVSFFACFTFFCCCWNWTFYIIDCSNFRHWFYPSGADYCWLDSLFICLVMVGLLLCRLWGMLSSLSHVLLSLVLYGYSLERAHRLPEHRVDWDPWRAIFHYSSSKFLSALWFCLFHWVSRLLLIVFHQNLHCLDDVLRHGVLSLHSISN